MDKFVIRGGTPLHGEISASGAKNAALPIIAATLLATEEVILDNVPRLRDINTSIELLQRMGADIEWIDDHSVRKGPAALHSFEAPYELVKTMRASILVLGPLLACYKQACVSLPGGCAIGARPVDLHISGLEALGAQIGIDQGYIHASCKKKLRGTHLNLNVASVTATENLIMAAALAEGETVIANAACEPEIQDLAEFLNAMGAHIQGAGTNIISIQGVTQLGGCRHAIMPDRIETGTLLVGAMMTGGHIKVTNTEPGTLDAVILKLREGGANLSIGSDWIDLEMSETPRAVNIVTAPHPGFPTDMQAQFSALNSISTGSAIISETIFENRFMHIPELQRMGANLHIDGHTVISNGVEKLHGAPVMATDLRASAGLVIAGLAAEGETTVERVYHLDRGYEQLELKLTKLGADIARVTG